VLEGKASQITMSASGDLAFEVGVNHMTFGGPKGDMLDPGKYLTVWKKTNGVWYVQALSFTSDAPAPVPSKK
jgi:ketosteroid isomerase-like protein